MLAEITIPKSSWNVGPCLMFTSQEIGYIVRWDHDWPKNVIFYPITKIYAHYFDQTRSFIHIYMIEMCDVFYHVLVGSRLMGLIAREIQGTR